MRQAITTLIAPSCTCCPTRMVLLPRDDLAGGMAACPTTGQLYQPAGAGYAPAALPPLAPERPSAPSVRIDLSRSSYA